MREIWGEKNTSVMWGLCYSYRAYPYVQYTNQQNALSKVQ